MRVLKFNDQLVDIDNETAIGITFQTYDVKEPAENFVNTTNEFTIPLTSNNAKIIGFGGNPHSENLAMYDIIECDYYIDNELVINKAKVRIESVADRASCFIYEKNDIWEQLRKLSYSELIDIILAYNDPTPGTAFPNTQNPFIGTYEQFVDGAALELGFNGLLMRAVKTNIHISGLPDTGIGTIYTSYPDNQFGFINCASLFLNFRIIFLAIEDYFNVNFGVNETFDGNIWNDLIASRAYTPVRCLELTSTTILGQDAFYISKNTNNNYYPLSVAGIPDKTAYDLIKCFFQHFNCIIDNTPTMIKIRRFDDIESLAEVVDFSGHITGKPIFKPTIENIAQNNFIEFSSIYSGGAKRTNSKNILCQNKNIDIETTLFTIDSHIPNFAELAGEVWPNLSTDSTFTDFVVLVDGELSTGAFTMRIGTSYAYNSLLYLPVLYSLTTEYNFYESILEYPEYYEIEKWLTLSEIRNLEFFKQYFIKELGGSFFINKISGYNPEKSLSATKIELIKISNKTPYIDANIKPWADGIGDIFVDGSNNYFI